MENSDQIVCTLTSPEITAFALGYGAGGDGRSIQIAWEIENLALALGWPEGCSLGSEQDLLERFNVNRDVLRGALRLVEARGAMRVERGRKGGLRLVRPTSDNVALALASYLSAWDYQPASSDILASLKQELSPLDHGPFIAGMMENAHHVLTEGTSGDDHSRTRAEFVAIRMIRDVGKPIPESGTPLGCEADLCEKFGLAHRTFRQSVSLLQDLGMLLVNRGRGGGYLLRRPSKIGLSRRLLAWIAAESIEATTVVRILLGFNLIRLRLACQNLAKLDEADRIAWCDQLSAQIADAAEPERWVLLQKALSRCANDLMINTVVSGLLAYIARLQFNPDHTSYEEDLHHSELDLISALRAADYPEAEAALNRGSNCMMTMALASQLPDPREKWRAGMIDLPLN